MKSKSKVSRRIFEWSGVPPESTYQIEVYLDAAHKTGSDPETIEGSPSDVDELPDDIRPTSNLAEPR